MPAASDFRPVRFSTLNLAERERVSRWREEFGRGIVSVEIEPLAPDLPFSAKATLQALPGVRTVLCSGSLARLNRTRALVADGDDSIGLVVNLGARANASQRGRDLDLDVGDAVPLFTDDACTLTSTRHLGILLPRAPLAARVSDLDGATMRVIPQSHPALRLPVSYLNLIRTEATFATPGLRQSVATHIHVLAALAFGANRGTEEQALTAVAAARLAAALAHIEKSFTDAELNLESTAQRLRISSRYLQLLLETTGTSFTARVNELRLQKAFALLIERGGGKRRISDIALEAGISEVSHFNRLFRARFGETPSGVRRSGDCRSLEQQLRTCRLRRRRRCDSTCHRLDDARSPAKRANIREAAGPMNDRRARPNS